MDNKNNQQTGDQDFTSKGRTANQDGNLQEETSREDISNIDQQEGTLEHGTTGKDQGLFSDEQNKADGTA